MKWTYVQVYTVYVSQTYDLCIYFDHFNTILIFFDTNFMLSRVQICVTTHILEINTTLSRFRDPIWCSHTQPTGRIWLCVQYWSRGEPIIILGTPFEIIDFKFWNEIMFVFTLFMFPNLIKWTLFLLVCWYIPYGGSKNTHTWTLYKISFGNCWIFREHLRNI